MNIFKIAFSNIRKRKGASITFLVMVFLSALMFTISLSLVTGTSDFFERKVDELNAPHMTSFIFGASYRDELRTWAEAHEHTTETAVMDTLFASGFWDMKDGSSHNAGVAFIGHQHNLDNSFFTPPIIDRQAAMVANSVILPISYRTSGFRSGENITFNINDQGHEFSIYGFFENPITGASTVNLDIVFVNDAHMHALAQDGGFIAFKTLMVRLQNANQTLSFETDFIRAAQLNDNEISTVSFVMAEMASMMFVGIMSTVLLVFAAIVLAIAFIVVVFSINSSIAEDRATIGVLKGIGYKSRFLRIGQLVQYLMIAAVGAFLGSLVAVLTFGIFGNIIASTTGLLWLSDSNVLPFFISIVAIVALTSIITYVATRKYKTITPIDAVRPTTAAKTRSRNVMPLENGQMPVNIHLGLKRFFASIKSNVVLTVVITLLVFVSMVVNVLNFNLNVDRTAMINMVGLEMSDLYAQAAPGVDITLVNYEINTHAEVDWTMMAGSRTSFINDDLTFVETMEDFSRLTMNVVVRGRHPVNTDGVPEVALGVTTLRLAGAEIGDVIGIEINGVTKDYRIVGIIQNIANGGIAARITHEAMLAHVPDFTFGMIYVYLNPDVDVAAYQTRLADIFGQDLLVLNTHETMDTILSSIGDPVQMLLVIMMVMNVMIIAFVIFLMLNTIIRKAKKEFGILKAIGYRNGQLVMQLMLSLLPSFILGATIGIILGFTLSNPMLSIMFAASGLLRTTFIVPGLVSVLIALGILGISITATYLIALRLRGISPQKLIVD